MESLDKNKDNENKILNKKRERKKEKKKESKNENKERRTKKSILNECYNLKPILKIENNMRFIEPYDFKYQLYIKERWLGKKIIDVLETEFNSYSREYFLNAINDGKILINDKKVTKDYILKRNDFLTHFTKRKENPIINQKIDIVYEDENYLVVDKPSSWPVHVCGGYQFNTLQRILRDDLNYKDIFVLHRLDKQTSGIVIFAKNKKSAENFRKNLEIRDVTKTYFARVKGNFEPKNKKVICKKYIYVIDKAKGIHSDISDEDLKKYLEEKKNKKINNINEIEENNFFEEKDDPKYAETEFEFVFYDEKSNTSVVKCVPKTGRTHQIRIHLRVLGFPIANDPCYGGIIYNDLKEFDNPDLKSYQISGDNNENISVSQLFCYKIWLHAWTYKFGEYEFKTKIPEWAQKDYVINYKF